ncbi:MAG: PrpF domain-containing protein, partial [Pseudomonadota bacterium]|nr:PrpF domain-containing protein [Pseudomonadota bacterium]
MTQTGLPFLFMRGGTSRGPYFNRADLPADRDQLAQVLIAAVGSGHPLNIDGIGETQVNSIKSFFSNEANLKVLNELEKVLVVKNAIQNS